MRLTTLFLALLGGLLLAAPAAGRSSHYCDPFLFPTANIGNDIELEISPAFARGGEDGDLPTQTALGVRLSALLGRHTAFELGAGHTLRSWNGGVQLNPYDFFHRVEANLKFLGGGRSSWVMFLMGAEFQQFSHTFGTDSDWEDRFEDDYGETWEPWDEESTTFHGMEYNLGLSFGFLLARRANLEFFLGLTYNTPDVAEDVWEYGHLWLPLATRVSYELFEGGYANLELRVAVDVGEVGDPSGAAFADMLLGYRHEIGNFLVGGGIFFGLNDFETTGRQKAGLTASLRYRFF